MTHFGSGIWSYSRRSTGAIFLVTVPATIIRSDCRVDRTRRHARAAVDALVGVNVEHLGRREVRFVFPRVDAVDRTHVDARGILGADARLADDIRHAALNDMRFGAGGALHAAAPAR